MFRWIILAGVLACLSGCGVDNWVAGMNNERFQNACSGFGFAPGTAAFSNCMMQQSAQNEAEIQSIQDRAALDEAAEKLKRRR